MLDSLGLGYPRYGMDIGQLRGLVFDNTSALIVMFYQENSINVNEGSNQAEKGRGMQLYEKMPVICHK